MNNMSSTKIFQSLDKMYNITKTVGTFDPQKYVVDKEKYDYLLQLMRGYKYPLARKILEACEDRTIVPVMFEEPKNPKDKVYTNVPVYLFAFTRSFNGKSKGFANISGKGSYNRVAGSNEIDFFKMDEVAFYGYMQASYTEKIFNEKADTFRYNSKFALLSCEVFSFILSRVIDKVYPIAAKRGGMDVLQYVIGVYFLQNMFEFPLDKAKQYALNVRSINKNEVINSCILYKTEDENNDMKGIIEVEENGSRVKVYPIDRLMRIIPREFPFIGVGELNYRSILFEYTQQYGNNTMLCLEHMFSFVNMLQMSSLNMGMFSDLNVDKKARRYTDELERIIVSV